MKLIEVISRNMPVGTDIDHENLIQEIWTEHFQSKSLDQ
jgi:hypothetical protein